MKNIRLRWRLLAIVCTLVCGSLAGAEPAGALRLPNPFQGDDSGPYCLEGVPEAVSARSVTDDGRTIDLDILVLLDGVSESRGRDVMSMAAKPYAPLGIRFRTSFRRVAFPGDGLDTDLFGYARRAVPDVRARGADVVYVLTDKDLYDLSLYDNGGRNYALAGEGYCIGGVRDPKYAFAIGEGEVAREYALSHYQFSAKTAAHEIGHLMGAHHHYGNCVEGDGSTDGGGGPSMCTVMWPGPGQYMSLKFGALEGDVIRGHAVEFATP
jgi:hypothetical protein